MVRLSLSTGTEMHGIRPNDIVSTIAFHANIPGSAIVNFHQDKRSLVDVPEALAGQVLAKSGGVRIRKLAMDVQRA